MTNKLRTLLLTLGIAGAMLVPGIVQAQTAITSTTLSVAMSASQGSPTSQGITVGSATNILVGSILWIEGSVYRVTAVSGTSITVTTQYMPASHLTSATVYVVPLGAQISLDPTGSCIRGTTGVFPTYSPYTLMFNTSNGHIAVCRGTLGSRTWSVVAFAAVVQSSAPPITP